MNTASSQGGYLLLLSEVKNLATGTQAFVGRAAIEVEMLDGLTNRRVIAAVDERAGTRRLRGEGGTWGDVKEAFDTWAHLLGVRLAVFRALVDRAGFVDVSPEMQARVLDLVERLRSEMGEG